MILAVYRHFRFQDFAKVKYKYIFDLSYDASGLVIHLIIYSVKNILWGTFGPHDIPGKG